MIGKNNSELGPRFRGQIDTVSGLKTKNQLKVKKDNETTVGLVNLYMQLVAEEVYIIPSENRSPFEGDRKVK